MFEKLRQLLLKDKKWVKYYFRSLTSGGNPLEKKEKEIKIGYETFIIEIVKNEEDIDEYYIKSLKYSCFLVGIKKNKFASIYSLGNDTDCVKTEEYKKKIGKIMIYLMFKIFKEEGVTEFDFTDNSGIIRNGKNYDLADLYFLKYGRTWYDKMLDELLCRYEINFNFPSHKTYQELKEEYKNIYNNSLKDWSFENLHKNKKELFSKLSIPYLNEANFKVKIIRF
jgi:hypothetical protein